MLQMKCPNCSAMLPQNSKEGEKVICLNCGEQVRIHYTLMDQLKDPVGILLRNPKYVRKQFDWISLAILILFIVLVVIQGLIRK